MSSVLDHEMIAREALSSAVTTASALLHQSTLLSRQAAWTDWTEIERNAADLSHRCRHVGDFDHELAMASGICMTCGLKGE